MDTHDWGTDVRVLVILAAVKRTRLTRQKSGPFTLGNWVWWLGGPEI